jgi:hypothetical protein
MRDPDYLAQTAEPTTKEGRRQWIEARRDEARTEGVTHARLSWDAHLNLILFEGWKVRPVDEDGNLDEGTPRFQFAALRE